MVWSKAYTSTESVSTTSQADTRDVLDDMFDTWLTSKGWSTSKFNNSGTSKKYYYAAKNVTLFGGSTKRFGIVLEYDYSSSSEQFKQYRFDTTHTPSASGPNTSNYQSDYVSTIHEGQWNFWTDTADSDCWAIITSNGRVISFWPPEESLVGTVHSGSLGSSDPSQPITPFLIRDSGNSNAFYDSSYGSQGMYPFCAWTSSQGENSTVPTAFYNYAAVKGNSSGLFMYDTSGRTALYVEDMMDETEINLGSGTLKVGTTYYIRIGADNSLLLNCGTTDPQV